MKKAGFTLAEVLIVLVILGVIASMTVPSLMSNSNQTVYITGAQKAYSTLNNAIQMASIERGVSPTGINGASDYYNKMFKGILKIAKTFNGSNGIALQTQDGMIYYFHYLNNTCQDMPDNPYSVSDTQGAPACGIVIVDVDGDKKGSNRVTSTNVKESIEDQFVFFLYRNGVATGNYPTGYILKHDYATDVSSAVSFTANQTDSESKPIPDTSDENNKYGENKAYSFTVSTYAGSSGYDSVVGTTGNSSSSQ